MTLIEMAGSGFGIFGALLIASNTQFSKYGWIGFALSSVLLTGYTYAIQSWGLFALQVCFCLTNAMGLWRWLISPWLHSLSAYKEQRTGG